MHTLCMGSVGLHNTTMFDVPQTRTPTAKLPIFKYNTESVIDYVTSMMTMMMMMMTNPFITANFCLYDFDILAAAGVCRPFLIILVAEIL